MATFTAHYQSPKAMAKRANGLFDFESENRLGSKSLQHDARLAMLERFGEDSLPWVIDKIERKKKSKAQSDGQLMIDFREPVAKPKRKKKKQW